MHGLTTRRTPPVWAAVLLVAALTLSCDRAGEEPDVTVAEKPALIVFAAASTADVMAEAASRYEQRSGEVVHVSADATSSLARQIQQGAPADIFISADAAWMDELEASDSIDPATRFDLLANSIVLVVPLSTQDPVRNDMDTNPADALNHLQRIALADPDHVPAGKYASQALRHHGWWEIVRERMITAPDVRAALRLVEMGEADGAFVYSTDALVSDKVGVAWTAPATTHEPIVYPVAAVAGRTQRARAFLDFLQSPEMLEVYVKAGFQRPADASRGDAPSR